MSRANRTGLAAARRYAWSNGDMVQFPSLAHLCELGHVDLLRGADCTGAEALNYLDTSGLDFCETISCYRHLFLTRPIIDEYKLNSFIYEAAQLQRSNLLVNRNVAT